MKSLAIIKKRFVRGMTWAMCNYELFVGLACLSLMFGSMLVLLSWFIGFWCNGILGTKFELQSCITGIGAIATGTLTLYGMIKAGMDKYKIDSKYNSKQGETPREG